MALTLEVNNDSIQAPANNERQQKRSLNRRLQNAVAAVRGAKRPRRSIHSTTLPNSIYLTGCLQKHLVDLFLDDNTSFLRNETGIDDLRTLLWFLRLPTLAARNTAVEASALALSCIAVGRSRHDHQMMRQGIAAYDRALKLISKVLSTPTFESQEQGMIVSFNLLAGQLFSHQPRDFASHIAGIGAIMQHRGPEAFASGTPQQFLLAVRLHLILGALVTRQGTFLAEEQWLCTAALEEGCSFEELIDITTSLPAIRARFVQTQNTLDSQAQLKNATLLAASAWSLRADLYRWSHIHSSETSQLVTQGEVILPAAKMAGEIRSYRFASLRDGIMMSLYWACLVELYNILGQFYEIIGLSHVSAEVPAAMPFDHESTGGRKESSVRPFAAAEKCRGSAMLYASHICSALQYFSFSDGNCFGSVYMLFPLKVAFRCFVLNLSQAAGHLDLVQDALHSLMKSGVYIVQSLATDNGIY